MRPFLGFLTQSHLRESLQGQLLSYAKRLREGVSRYNISVLITCNCIKILSSLPHLKDPSNLQNRAVRFLWQPGFFFFATDDCSRRNLHALIAKHCSILAGMLLLAILIKCFWQPDNCCKKPGKVNMKSATYFIMRNRIHSKKLGYNHFAGTYSELSFLTEFIFTESNIYAELLKNLLFNKS